MSRMILVINGGSGDGELSGLDELLDLKAGKKASKNLQKACCINEECREKAIYEKTMHE